METESEISDDEGAAAVAIRRSFRDLRQGLHLELERLEVLEALLAIPQEGCEASEREQKWKTTVADDAVELAPGLGMSGGEKGAAGRCIRDAVADSGRPRTLTKTTCRGLLLAPTEVPPPPDAGEKPEPPPCFHVAVTQVPEAADPGSRPTTPTFIDPDNMAEALVLKVAAQSFHSVKSASLPTGFPAPPLQPGGPPEMPDSAEIVRSASLPVGAAAPGSQGSGSVESAGGVGNAGDAGASCQAGAALLTPNSADGSEKWKSKSGKQHIMDRTMEKLRSMGNSKSGVGKSKSGTSTAANKGDGMLARTDGGAISGELAHYKRSWDMEKKKEEMIKSKSAIDKGERRRAGRIVKDTARHSLFEAFFATAILSSAMVYGAEVQYYAHHPHEVQPVGFFVMHQVFTALFLIELFVRMYSVGVRSFFCTKEHWLWGWLDLIVCASSLLESVLGILLLLVADGKQTPETDPMRLVRVLRVLRMSRAFRLQRFMWFVSSLRTLVYSIAATLKSLFWAMVLLLTIVFVFAMCFTQFTIDFSIDPDADATAVQEMKLYWGSLDRSMLTLFQSIAGGMSWREAALPMEEVSILLLLLFVSYIAFVYFAVLNVVTGVFCSSAIETTQHTPELIARSLIDNKHVYEEELKKLFNAIDAGNTGLITLSEFESLQGDEMTLAYFRALEIDFADAWSIFKLIDEDKGGAIEIDEFVRGCQQLRGGASSLEIQELAFDLRKLSEHLHKGLQKTDERLEELSAEIHGVGGGVTTKHVSRDALA